MRKVNIYNVNSTPVFFEIIAINQIWLEHYIKANVKPKKKREQLLKYLDEWPRL